MARRSRIRTMCAGRGPLGNGSGSEIVEDLGVLAPWSAS
jgi:hypothetical protein